MDSSEDRPRYLHMFGNALTYNRFWAWTGTAKQFNNIVEQNNWSNLSPVLVDKLPK